MSQWSALVSRLADDGVDVDAGLALRLIMGLEAGIPLVKLADAADVPLTRRDRLALSAVEQGAARRYVAAIIDRTPPAMTRLEQRVIRDCVSRRRVCACGCGRALPIGCRRHRRWWSDACRVRVSRNSAQHV
ncbi:MAG: hypothetical protein KGL39_41310 [Patescibacteria group bacterium]|nr:hypothetical protein [Patescibacteria group bacterium]